MKKLFLAFSHVILALIPVVLFFWLLNLDVTPSGRFMIHYEINRLSPFMDRFLPDTRVTTPQDGPDGAFSLVVDEPAYAAVHAPGDFDTLEVTLQFQNTDQPIIELGILQNDDPLQYELRPMQNLIIDNSIWDRIEQDGLVLLQRAKIYGTMEDFLAYPPDRDTLATYHYDLQQPLIIPDYVAANALTTTNVSLRGYHEYLTYIKNEPLLIQADLMDMNREAGDDPVELLVFDADGVLVANQLLEDDGVIEANNQGSAMRSVALVKNDLTEGVYKVILKADRDIFFRRLTTRQRYMTFIGSIYLGDEVGYKDDPSPIKFWTDGKRLSFYTYHADAAERVTVGTGSLALPEAQVRYDFEVVDPGVVPVSAAAGDFTMTQDGVVAFDTNQLFHPYPTRLNSTTDLDALGINFIIAEYTAPTQKGAWTSAMVTFDLGSALNTDGDIKLVLSAPGIKTLQKNFKLHAINLIFIRPALDSSEVWDKLKQFINL